MSLGGAGGSIYEYALLESIKHGGVNVAQPPVAKMWQINPDSFWQNEAKSETRMVKGSDLYDI